jgi:Acetyltransferase (GNAT) domain
MLARPNAIAYPQREPRLLDEPVSVASADERRVHSCVDRSHLAAAEPSSLTKASSIYTLNPLSDRRWDDLIARHPDASAFHQRGWLEALARTYGYEPVVFTTSPPTTALKNGLVFCRVKSWLTGSRLVSLPFSDHCEPLCGSLDELGSLISCADATLKRHGWRYMEVRPVNEQFGKILAASGFRSAGNYFVHVMDLRPRLDELFRGLDKGCVQRRIRRAERAGLVEQTGTSERLLKDFYGLFVLTRRRHHLPPPPYRWFQNLVRCLSGSVEIRLAYKDEQPIAAILTMRFGKAGYFKYGCSDARFHKFGATPWLLWNAIAAAKSDGALTFDMGRTQDENVGLFAFKNHWVRSHQRLAYWRFPNIATLDSADGWKLRMAKRVFSFMPNRLLTAAGSLIYPHIG